MAVYGRNDPEYQKKKRLEKFKKDLPPGKGWQGKYDQFGREYDTTTGKLKEALSRSTYYSDFAKKDAKKEQEHKKKDARMKHGKNWKQFTQDVERVRSGGKGIRGTRKGKWGTFNKGVFTPDN